VQFNNFDLDSRLLSCLPKDFVTPTPIQTQAIPLILSGKDLLGLARTGSGKTAAFILPILEMLKGSPRGRVAAIIIAPTRELVGQIDTCLKMFARNLGLKSCCVYGGTSINSQIRQLREGVEIIVACPGRLLDIMRRKVLDLSSVKTLVLDEADQMFDMGFLRDIKAIVAALPKNRQNLLFSATMPAEIKELAVQILKNPTTVNVKDHLPTGKIFHAFYPVKQERKTELLLKLMDGVEMNSLLIFTRTKARAKKLSISLKEAGHKAACIQGNLSQTRREEAMKGFRNGKYQTLVATDIAARGIDVSTVSHVINFDIPDTVTAYTHRSGRTGRAERSGDAYTFFTAEDRSTLAAISKELGEQVKMREIEGLTEIFRASEKVSAGGRHENNFRRFRARPKGHSASARWISKRQVASR